MLTYEMTLFLVAAIILFLLSPSTRNKIKFYYKYLFFFVYLSVISTIGFFMSIKNPKNCKSMLMIAALLNPLGSLIGIKWKIRNSEKIIGPNKSSIFISNHQTIYDIPAMLHLWHEKSIICGTIAKNLLFWLWPVGLAMWIGGTVFIKRKTGSEKTIKRFNTAAKQIFNNHDKLWVYVEGTRNKNPEKLLPFKKGAFVSAIENQVPLQPVVISPFYFIDFDNKRFDSGTVIIEVLDPISTEGLTKDDVNTLIKKAYDIMSQKNTELRNEMEMFCKNRKA